MRFRKKPVEVEAIQLDISKQVSGSAWWSDVAKWASDLGINTDDWVFRSGSGIEINTLEGVMTAMPWDWIIRGVRGECYPCKPDIFQETYENVDCN